MAKLGRTSGGGGGGGSNAVAAITSGTISGVTISSSSIASPSITGAVTVQGATGRLPVVLLSSGIPFIHLSSGSVSAAGAISGITALPVAYPAAYCYFPANILATANAAGWKYCTFSTATAGTAFLDTYTSGAPMIPASPTAVVDGKGAFTGDTTVRTAIDLTIPAGSMGPNGYLRIRCVNTETNNANAKTGFLVKLGGAGGTTHMTTTTVSTLGLTGEVVIHNVGVQTAQSSQFIVGAPGSSGALTRSSIDTSASTTVVIQIGKTGAATDNVALENYSVEVVYGT